MKTLLGVLLTAVGLCAGCSRSEVLSPAEFTLEYAEALEKADPIRTVTILGDLELKVTTAEGRELTAFLNNAFDDYKLAPGAKAEVIARFVTAFSGVGGDVEGGECGGGSETDCAGDQGCTVAGGDATSTAEPH